MRESPRESSPEVPPPPKGGPENASGNEPGLRMSLPRAQRLFRRVLRKLVLWGIAFGCIALALTALAHTKMAREYAGREVANVLRNELGLVAEIDDVHVDPRALEVVARGIRLTHPKFGPLARAESLRIRPSWRTLFRLKLDLNAIELTRPDITLKIRDGKVLNGPELPTSTSATTAPAELPFNRVTIEQARVAVDAGELGSAELRGIELQVRKLTSDSVRVHLKIGEGQVVHTKGRDRLLGLELLSELSPEQISIQYARVETPHVHVSARNAQAKLPFGTRYAGDVKLDVHLPQLGLWPLPFEFPPFFGDVHVAGRIESDPQGTRAKLDTVLTRVGIDQYTFGEKVILAIGIDPNGAVFSGEAQAIHEGGTLGLKGELGFGPTLPLKVRGKAHDVGFAKLMEQLGVSPNAIVDWTIAGDLTLAGTLNPLRLSGPLRMPTRDFKVLQHAWHEETGHERRVIGIERALLDGTVGLTLAGITFTNVDITLPTSKLNASHVLLGFDASLRVSATGSELNLVDASPLVGIEMGGHGTFSVEVGGTFTNPTMEGHGDFREYAMHGFQLGDMQTDFALDEDLMGVHFGRIDARKNDSRYAIEGGYLDFREDAFRAGGKTLVERLTLADFYEIFRYQEDERFMSYQGTVSGAAELSYSLGRPTDSPFGTLAIDLELDIPQAELDGYAFTNGGFKGRWDWTDPDAGYEGGKLSIERFVLRKGEGTLSISGRMGLLGALDLVAVGDRLSLRDLESIGGRTREVSGTLGVNASIKGFAKKPRMDVDLALTGLALRGESLGDGRAYVRLTDQEDPWITEALNWPEGAPPADAQCGHAREGLARGNWPEDPPLRTFEGPLASLDQPMAYVMCGEGFGGQLVLDIALGRTKATPLRGQITLDQLDLGRLLPRVRGRPPLRGAVSAKLNLTDGAVSDPFGLAGTLSISSVRVGQLDVELQNKGPVELSFSRGRFEVHRATFAGPSSELRIAGGGSQQNGLQLRFDGSVDLGLLTTLSRTVKEAEGTVTLGFNVSGPFERPAIFGEAAIRGASLQVASFPEAVRNVHGRVTFSERRIVLDDFSAQVASGTVKWSGDATLDGRGIGGYDIQLDADGLSLKPRDGVSMKIGGRAALRWRKTDRIPTLAGTLRIDEMIYTRAIAMDRTIGDITAVQRTEVTGYDPADDLIALDLRLEHSRPLFIRNNLIDAELRLETDKLPFRLVGTDQRFGVVGHVSVRKGTLRFRDQAFEIRQGDITFDDETRIDPSFDLRAATEVRRTTDQTSWQIQIHAFGRRDEFRFELSSDPYLTEDDIALLLTLGMTHSELAQLETGDLTSTAALEALATVTGVEREVQRALPQIDDFHIASAYSEQSNRTEPQLFVGKRIARNLRLNASTGIAESRDFSTGVQLQLTDQTAVEAVYNNQNATSASQIGDVGVDLKWRLEFD